MMRPSVLLVLLALALYWTSSGRLAAALNAAAGGG